MKTVARREHLASRPRAIVVGSYRDPFNLSTEGFSEAIAAEADIVHIPATSPVRHALRVFNAASRAIRDGGYELVHVLDPRFAPVGVMLQRRYDVPVSVSISSTDVGRRSPMARVTTRALNHLDHGFTSEDAVASALRGRAPRLPVSVVPPGASALPWPSKRGISAMTRTLRGVRPGRLVVALPWPDDRNDLRWFRDVVAPQLDARPLCLLMGAPSRRQARLLIGAMGMRGDFRIHSGRLNADLIASAARCVDAFVVCGSQPLPGAPGGQFAIALSTGGVPVVTNAAEDARVLAQERNAFVVDPRDERGYVHTLNQILALPAIQRHVLGEEFARFTLGRWPWRDVAAAYTERFAALVGRPQIPADLRAAA